MKSKVFAVFVCCTVQLIHSAGMRNAIFLFDWGKERLGQEFGPVSVTLLAALQEKAAPIIVSSQTWHNVIGRGKIFDDVVHGRIPSAVVHENVQREILNKYNKSLDKLRWDAHKDIIDYYISYSTFYSSNPVFKPHEWLVKKLSDYLYLLVPIPYVQQLQRRDDTPAIGRKLSTRLTVRERALGLKLDKFPDIPVNVLLDMTKQAVTFNYTRYQELTPKSAHNMIRNLQRFKWQKVLEGYFFGQHINHMLGQIFVTRSDLRDPEGNREETDLNEAYFLHKWIIYQDGHGSLSEEGPVMPVMYEVQRRGWGSEIRSSIAFLGGIELGAFRQLLGFLNNNIQTGAFVYTSCYSGGKHLIKLFEHQWDYPVPQERGTRRPIQKYTLAKQDVFNYLIIATNLWYTETLSIGMIYSRDRRGNLKYTFGVRFWEFFADMAAFLTSQLGRQYVKQQRRGVKPPPHEHLRQELTRVLRKIHSFDFKNRFQIPAIRFPYTEWFVALNDPGTVVLLDEYAQHQQQLQQYEQLLKPILQEKIKEQERRMALKELPHEREEQLKKEQAEAKERELFERIAQMREEQRLREQAQRPTPEPQLQPSDFNGQPTTPKTMPAKPRRPLPPRPRRNRLQNALFNLNLSLQRLRRVLR